jgi:hypothetical protein
MAELVRAFKDALWFRNKKSITIDSSAFKTSSQLTPALLVLGSLIVTARQFFGHPIKCDPGAVCYFRNISKIIKCHAKICP